MNPIKPPPVPAPAASAVADTLVQLGVSHVVSLPDNTSAPVLEALQLHPSITLLFGTREGEVISLASGLWLGGARPAVLIQNTGLLESGDGLRGTASRMGAPLLLMVTCRGYPKSRKAGAEPGDVPPTGDFLTRPDMDSVALMTEPTLDAWGIPFRVMTNSSDLGLLEAAWNQAHEEERPVALLLDTHFG